MLLLLIEFFPVLSPSLPSLLLLLLLLVTGRCGEPMLGQHIRIRLALPPRTTPRSISSRESRNEKWETRLVLKCYTALHCSTLLTLLYTGCRQFSCYFESAKSQVLKRFIFLHTDLQLQRCPSVRLSSFLLLVPPSFALSLFLLLSLSASFFFNMLQVFN